MLQGWHAPEARVLNCDLAVPMGASHYVCHRGTVLIGWCGLGVGVLESIDQFLNFKLNDIVVLDSDKYPHLVRRPPLRNQLFVCPF
jgi:hypothetical protein